MLNTNWPKTTTNAELQQVKRRSGNGLAIYLGKGMKKENSFGLELPR